MLYANERASERVHNASHHAGRIAMCRAEVNLLDVAKENMIGVVYEILPLAVINSEQTVVLAWSLG